MLVHWEDGFGNAHQTEVLALFTTRGERYVVTEHPRDQFRPLVLRVVRFHESHIEADAL